MAVVNRKMIQKSTSWARYAEGWLLADTSLSDRPM